MKEIHVRKKDVAAIVDATFPEYKGKKFKIKAANSITFSRLNWSNGAKDEYVACGFNKDKQTASYLPWPSTQYVEGNTQELYPGIAIVMHTRSGSQDLGLTIYMHPDNIPTNLTVPKLELTNLELLVLYYTKTHKCKYNGKDRYQMAREDVQAGVCKLWVEDHLPSRIDWLETVIKLQDKKLLNSKAAITVEGKNILSQQLKC